MDGNSDYLTIPDTDYLNWDFGQGDFTLDFWARYNATAGNQCFMSNFQENGVGWLFRSEGTLLRFTDGIGDVSVSWTPSTNTQYHIALVRSGSGLYFFVGGNQQGETQTAFTVETAETQLWLGNSEAAAAYFNGWFDEIRISKGIARWTANFTPPNREYGMDEGSFLLNFV